MDVSIIFVNYNTKEMTAEAIRSVFDKTEGLSFEMIVVDNASTDGSVQYLRDTFGGKIRIMELDENLGFGKANNLAMEQAVGEYYFLLNTDTLLINNAIKILYDFMEQHPNVGVAGGNLYDEQHSPAHSFSKKLPSVKSYSISYRIVLGIGKIFRGNKRIDFNYTDKPKSVGYITGADMMVRKSVLEKVGVFDKDFFMYYEEAELSHRIQKAGYGIMSVPQAKITHLEGASFGKDTKEVFRENRTRMFAESAMLYYQKVYGTKSVKKFYKTYKRKECFSANLKALFGKKHDKTTLKRRMQILDEEYDKWLKNQQSKASSGKDTP